MNRHRKGIEGSRQAALGVLAAAVVFLGSQAAWSQDIVSDLFGGKLIKPKAGQWVWYTVTDAQGEELYALRQAVIGEEKVGRQTGYWIEFEIIPQIGYKTFYKVLLTGPASDPRSIQRILVREGFGPSQEVPVQPDGGGQQEPSRPKRKSHGIETVSTGAGPLRAEHIEVTQGDRVVHLWVDEKVRPTGIVRMQTPSGEMVLRSYGSGGEYGASAIDKPIIPSEAQVGTDTEEKPQENMEIQEEKDAVPEAQEGN